MHLLLSVILLAGNLLVEGTEEGVGGELGTEIDTDGHVSHPAHACLLPSFILTLGVTVYYVLSRYLHFLPYTAIMFLLGTIMGIISATEVAVTLNNEENFMHDTIFAWQNINSEVLLLVFLPGLLFKDALGQNPHLFSIGFVQLFIFAFPLVLAGTTLTACIGFFIFDYGWSWSLCMTFGSILSATDPVAVAALLEEVGAPPRLKTHVAGESLLNDGAAIVFFYIFQDMFLNEFGIEGFGENIDFKEGVKIFFRMALGGAAIGIAFGSCIILLLFYLNRRFSREENIVQVTAVLGMAYLNYFVSDLVCHTSGVIAVVFAGLTVKFFGRGSINNIHLMEDFFSVTEHILNTILFTLGGLVWGQVIIRNHKSGLWTGKDWGYLILLYVLLHVIRAFLFLLVYPITSRIGLKTNLPETVFQIYGGLRGAVGIALAIAIDNEVGEVHEGDNFSKEYNWVSQLYQMVGGVALLTLVINGTSAGPVLIWLGLAKCSEARRKVLVAYRVHLRAKLIDSFVELLTSKRFEHVQYAFVEKHIPFVSELTLEQLVEAVEHLEDTTPTDKYCPPYLGNILKDLKNSDGFLSDEFKTQKFDILRVDPDQYARKKRMQKRTEQRECGIPSRMGRLSRMSSMSAMMKDDPLSTKEMRLLFISMLRAQYENQINEGFLSSQHGLTIALQQSLEEAETEVSNGGSLNDLHYLQKFYGLSLKFDTLFSKATCGLFEKSHSSVDHIDLTGVVLQEVAFAVAHTRAQVFFQEQLGDFDEDLSEAGKIVLSESKIQMKKVTDDLNRSIVKEFVIQVCTHKFCEVLLNKGIKYVEDLHKNGLMNDTETEEMMEEMVHLLKEVKEAKVEVKEAKIDMEGPMSALREENGENLADIKEDENEIPVTDVDDPKEGYVADVEVAEGLK